MPAGYHGTILHVDLGTGALTTERPTPSFYRHLMGGSAMGAAYCHRLVPRGGRALEPDNVLVLAGSVVTGAAVSGASRLTAVARSPLTDALGDSQCGGAFAAGLKLSGFDGVVVCGRAPGPCYLLIHDGKAQLRPAEQLWGLETAEAEAAIRDELAPLKVEVLQCGPAGERGVRFAALITMSSRACGRTGLGAVMGSKNLKAVVVAGRSRPVMADPEAVNALARWGAEHYEGSAVYGIGTFGTASVVRSQNAAGGLPTRNWQSGAFDGWESLDGKRYSETILKGRHTCTACTIRCKRVVEAVGEPFAVRPVYGGPEYETLGMFGSGCGIADLPTVARANQLCNAFGMDTISCGATIAWAIECFERGLIALEDTGGQPLHFGDGAAVLELVDQIGRREGFGRLLGEGSARAAQVLGRGTETLLTTVKRQEMPAHMPQVKRALGLVYAVNPFGPDHESSAHDPTYAGYPQRMAELGLVDPQPNAVLNREKVRFARLTGLLYACQDSLSVCSFAFGPAWQLFGPSQLVELVRAVTGWDVTLAELMRVGERRLNLFRSFNAREGFGPGDDRLPDKLFVPLQGGASDGVALDRVEMEQAVRWYYEDAGWDAVTGAPSPEKLRALGLEAILA